MGIVVLIILSEKKYFQTFVNKKVFAKSTKMYAVLRRNLRDLRIIASQVQRLQARTPQSLVRTYMQGKGSRAEINNIWIQGMTAKSMKHHYALIPLFVIMAIGMAFVAAFCARLAIYSPDTNWSRDDYDNVAGYYGGKRHIFFNPYNIDFEKFARERPNYKDAEE